MCEKNENKWLQNFTLPAPSVNTHLPNWLQPGMSDSLKFNLLLFADFLHTGLNAAAYTHVFALFFCGKLHPTCKQYHFSKRGREN